MDDLDKMAELKIVLEDETIPDAALLSYLRQAENIILNRMYPYLDEATYVELTVPAKYEYKQIRIAAYMINKRGAEGETQHIENGIHRNYGGADVPADMLRDILPAIGIPR